MCVPVVRALTVPLSSPLPERAESQASKDAAGRFLFVDAGQAR